MNKTFAAIATFLLSCATALGQQTVRISPPPKLQFFTQAGVPLANGCVFTYAAGTTTPQATYTDSTGTVTNQNPVVLDGGGFGSIWLTSQAYKFKVVADDGLSDQCASGAVQYTIDGITWAAPPPGSFSTITDIGPLTIQPAIPANSGANQASPLFSMQSFYWNGTASATDTCSWQASPGAGSNPQITYILTCLGSTGGHIVQWGPDVEFLGPNPYADIRAYGALCNDDGSGNGTDDTAAVNSALANECGPSKNGGAVYVPPSPHGCKITGQITIPNDGASPPNTKSCRLFGSAAGGVTQFFPDNGCNGGSTLNMTLNAANGKIVSQGLGKVEVDHICFKDTNTDFTPWWYSTLTVANIHDNQFLGNPTHFASPPTQTGQSGIVLGGTGTTATGNINDMFQGYGTVVRHNQFDYCGKAILLQNETNSVNIESNHFFNHCTNLTDGPITVNPGGGGNATFRSVIANNLIEVGASKYGIHLVQSVNGYFITGNACWDSLAFTTACIKEEASAGNVDNFVITVQQDSNSGTPLPDQITSASSRVQNGRFLAAWNTTNLINCVTPEFGVGNSDTSGGMSVNGGGTAICNGGNLSLLFNNNSAGDYEGGSNMVLGWQSSSFPVWANTPVTQLSQPGAGVLSVDTTGTGNALGFLRLSRVQSASGTANMGLTLKKGSGSGNYTTASTTYVQVDGTNLTNTVTIPTGWKLFVQFNGGSFWNTAIVTCSYAIADGGTTIQEGLAVAEAAGLVTNVSIGTVITGDGASHTVDLRFKTGNGADSCGLVNSTSTNAPTVVYTLMPSN